MSTNYYELKIKSKGSTEYDRIYNIYDFKIKENALIIIPEDNNSEPTIVIPFSSIEEFKYKEMILEEEPIQSDLDLDLDLDLDNSHVFSPIGLIADIGLFIIFILIGVFIMN